MLLPGPVPSPTEITLSEFRVFDQPFGPHTTSTLLFFPVPHLPALNETGQPFGKIKEKKLLEASRACDCWYLV